MRVWLVLSALLTLSLVRLPLFGVVGFELALVAAAFGSLAGLALGADLVRRAQRAPARPLDRAVVPQRLVLALIVRAPLAPLLVIAIPFAGAALHGLWAPTCEWGYGIEAYASMAVASTLLASGGGVLVGLVVGPRIWRVVVGLAAVVVFFITVGLARFYSEPAVFSYNPLIGFFPGNLYDEDIRLGWALYWSRLEQLATLAALLAAVAVLVDAPSLRVRLRRRHHRPALVALSVAAPAALVAMLLRWQAASLGYAIDAEDIWAELGGTRRTEHFVIHYANRPDIAADIEVYALDHELRLAQVCRVLGVDVARVGTIHSYVFADAEQKGRLMGARRVEMAKPWRREIYLTYEDFPHASLRHEIAHVVAGTFGSDWFHVSARSPRLFGIPLRLPLFFNPGMIEGLAVAADWPGGSRSLTPHQSMRAMDQLGIAPSAADVLGVRFLTLSSAKSYTAAGSFMHFLLERYGAERLRALYRSGGDFQAAYHLSQRTLVDEWRRMLSTVVVPASDLEAARERFRQRGVFQRPCPHANARRLRRAATARREQAIAILRTVCTDAPDEPSYQLELAERLVIGGAGAELAEGRAIFERFAAGERGAILAAEALRALIQVEANQGHRAEMRALVERGLGLALDDERRRPFEAMRAALEARGFAGLALRTYFFDSGFEDGEPLAAAFLTAFFADDGLGWYLVGLRAAERNHHALAAFGLAQGFARGLPSRLFVRNGARRLAVEAYRAGDRAALDTAMTALAASDYETDRALAADWRERADGPAGVTSR